ncbi:Regulator of chromosome condensation 1/beta-lactamase-inhibitor protein II [Dioscorea alata]|uniref:Regulator of chromosome condensation 1/beta-lactamase-inhibitor protein II n=3 Tax=Dioscorea alata TaxID=55571 RepID=A0ACB7W1I0_DIOAL|nr:Regulator of chromosome condensation 1/beta-lactamase-inhibitor protein II [Dioscorea alata]KAH7681527.1 Regulator of chromosome condensation 1/beta-lactamase-inhibitor protein II [Dioscorea alata]
MDATTSGASPPLPYHNIIDQPLSLITPLQQTCQRLQRRCYGISTPGEFPLAAHPSVVLHVLTSNHLDPQELAYLEATCKFFRQPANFAPDTELSISELAALDMCQERTIFKPMSFEEREVLKQRCGGSWKLVLRFLLAGEYCSRREKSQMLAGPGHSVAVTSKGEVYTFGSNSLGQLGHGTLVDEWKPRPVRSLQGIKIVQAAVGASRTMLISDTGRVYAFGKDTFGETEFGVDWSKLLTTPQLIESLKNVFVVQASIGNFFTAVLSREGRVYTFSWGSDERLGHHTQLNDVEPHQLKGPLENIPVVQISAGHCYLLALAYAPRGMSVYSVGCGLGGKLGHGTRSDEKYPKLIEEFHTLNLQPVMISAGSWHAAVVGQDGRVCTWGWGRHGCLGHGNEDCAIAPKVVEALSQVKVAHVATGDYTTFAVSEDGNVYSFGNGESLSLGHATGADGQPSRENVLIPKLVTSLKLEKEKVVQISLTNSVYWNGHTFALTDNGNVYAFGSGDKGQLGIQLDVQQMERGNPEQVEIDLS